MLRLNLKPPSYFKDNSTKLTLRLIGFLLAMLGFQVFIFTIRYYQNARLLENLGNLRETAQVLERKKAELTGYTADSVALAGAVEERNQWFAEKIHSPQKILEKLEAGRPQGMEFKKIVINRDDGFLQVMTTDADNASRFLNNVFLSRSDRLTAQELNTGETLISFTWSK